MAGALRTRLLELQHSGELRRPIDELARERINTIRDLLRLGSQFGPHPEQRLDTSAGSSPAKLGLARELANLAPKQLDRYRTDFDMQKWVEEAVDALDAVKARRRWVDLQPETQEFVRVELEPFLRDLLASPPKQPDW